MPCTFLQKDDFCLSSQIRKRIEKPQFLHPFLIPERTGVFLKRQERQPAKLFAGCRRKGIYFVRIDHNFAI